MIRLGLGLFCLMTAIGILEDPIIPFNKIEVASDWLLFCWIGISGFALIIWAILDLTTEPRR